MCRKNSSGVSDVIVAVLVTGRLNDVIVVGLVMS